MTRAEDKPRMAAIGDPVLGITSEKLQKLQEEDESLLRVRELGGGGGWMSRRKVTSGRMIDVSMCSVFLDLVVLVRAEILEL